MKERKKVSGVEKYSAWLHFTSVDSAIFAGRWYMYGRFDVMDLGRRVDFLMEWRECSHSMLCPKMAVSYCLTNMASDNFPSLQPC